MQNSVSLSLSPSLTHTPTHTHTHPFGAGYLRIKALAKSSICSPSLMRQALVKGGNKKNAQNAGFLDIMKSARGRERADLCALQQRE